MSRLKPRPTRWEKRRTSLKTGHYKMRRRHPPRTAGATQARGHEEEVGRVGEDEVDRGFGNECVEFEGIAEG
jgi:hypothetical protein